MRVAVLVLSFLVPGPWQSSLTLAQDDGGAPPPGVESAEEPVLLTLQDTFSLPGKIRPRYPRSQGWLDGDSWISHVSPDGEESAKVLSAVDALTGAIRPLYDPQEMQAALAVLPGITDSEAKRWSRRSSYHMSDGNDAVLLNVKNNLYHYRFGSEVARRLTSDPTDEVGETISPDGKLVAYINDFNLHVVGVDDGVPLALTDSGDENLLMGRLDWVYQEELYGRGNWQAYWWSPDSTRLAFLALDESPVPEYVVVDHRETRPDVEVWRYPKAGDPNPRVKVGVVDAAGGDVRWLDLSRYETGEFLVVRVGWTPDSSEVVLQVQNRIQTWLDVVAANPRTGETRVLFRDSTPVWTEPTDAPFWVGEDGRFLWLSERDGFRHLYLYGIDGTLERRLTEGPFEIDQVHGTDLAKGLVYVTSDRDDVKGSKLFQVALDGSGMQSVSEQDGSHSISMSPSFEYYLDTFSSLSDPGWAAVIQNDGKLVRILAAGTREPLEKFNLEEPEFVKVETRDGFEMEALIIRPPDFDPQIKYPVLSYVYGGPHAQSVGDRFFSRNLLWHQMLAQRGYLIWICDNRSASGKGLESVKGIYKRLGEQELADLEDGIDWLVGQGFADPERIGIWGWSYGGFMASYALTHSKKFKIGIAGAPVTDWRYYDSIYTERYMDRPQANPEGYRDTSVVHAAKDLHGKLLLIHGTIDENVHVQNTLNLAEALQKANKTFELMLYPGNRHSVGNRAQRIHLYSMMADFVQENL